MVGGQRIHDLVPHSSTAPANEAIVAGGVRAKVLRQITPRRTRTQNPKDAVEHAPVIYTGHAARLVRQERLDGGPFIIGEFVAHDSRLQFGSLNHAPGGIINPPGSVKTDANTLILLPLSGAHPTWRDLLLASSRSKMTPRRHSVPSSQARLAAVVMLVSRRKSRRAAL